MKRALTAAALLAVASGAAAADLDRIETLDQEMFLKLSEDLGAALSYKALAPAEPLGLTGFDIGLEATATSLANADEFERATGESMSTLVVPKVHLHKGLPLGLDVGAFYSVVPTTNITLTGAELRYAILEGGIATPALALRGTWTRMDGVDQMDLTTTGLELTVSKGFAMLTPYAGLGNIWVDSDPASSTGLDKESFTETKLYAGLNFNMGLTNLALEADKTGEATTWGAKLGFRW